MATDTRAIEILSTELTKAWAERDELLAALKAVMAVLRAEAPGTALNHHRFDAIGIKANNAIAKAEGK